MLASAAPTSFADIIATDPTTAYLPTCNTSDWRSPLVWVHTHEFTGNKSAMETAITQVDAQIGKVGASGATVDQPIFSTEEAFHPTTPYGDGVPTLHIGFSDLAPNILATTSKPYSCERFITFDSNGAWDYGTPEDAGGAGYYMAGRKDPQGNSYFRIAYLHELLRSMGVGTTPDNPTKDNSPNDVYSFLNSNERPWAHAPADAMIRPLPYDVRQLRSLFPGSGSRTEVAILNTWMDKSSTDPATPQNMLCAPSVGTAEVENNMFLPYCGNANATSICPGDMLQVHYGLANYSTEDVTVTSNLYFSTDDQWDAADKVSPTNKTYTVTAAHSQHKWGGFQVPSLPSGSTLYAIVRVTATTPSGVTVKDSIPMRGTVSPRAVCASLHQ